MVISHYVCAQRYFDGHSDLRYLPLFNTMNKKFTPRAACQSRFESAASEQRRRTAK
jgi:hypothetical protein